MDVLKHFGSAMSVLGEMIYLSTIYDTERHFFFAMTIVMHFINLYCQTHSL